MNTNNAINKKKPKTKQETTHQAGKHLFKRPSILKKCMSP